MPKELRLKNLNDLKLQENELREEFFNLNLQKGVGHLEKTHRLKEIKKTIARIKTILNEKSKGNVLP